MPQVIITGSHWEGCDPQSPEEGTSDSLKIEEDTICLLYTSDAADEELIV